MKKILFLVLLFSSCFAFSQQQPKKIKIILLGTFHFNQSLDEKSRLHSNLFDAKRRNELDDIIAKLVKQKPDKIFLEFTAKNQSYYDSIYLDYLHDKKPEARNTLANEIFQLGMRSAKILGHKKVYGMNYQPEELGEPDYQPINKVDSAVRNLYVALSELEDTVRSNHAFYDLKFPYVLPNQDSLLQKSTLTQFLLFLNSEKKLMRDEYTNWNWLYSVGVGEDMSFTDYVGTFWYGTNVRNFNNVLRNVDYQNDKCYLVVYGSSHIAFLRYLFKMNPFFEVVDLDKVLK